MGRKLCVIHIVLTIDELLMILIASVGLYTIQIAAMYGFKIITTCSPRNFELVKSSGATNAFDYNDSDVVRKIQDIEPSLRYVFDTIGSETSSVTASQAITELGGGLCTVRPDKSFTEATKPQTDITAVLVWTAFMKENRFGDIVWPVRLLVITL
jgi:NADPH:quinone reductase-like Zn-dependent oxidoreductase